MSTERSPLAKQVKRDAVFLRALEDELKAFLTMTNTYSPTFRIALSAAGFHKMMAKARRSLLISEDYEWRDGVKVYVGKGSGF